MKLLCLFKNVDTFLFSFWFGDYVIAKWLCYFLFLFNFTFTFLSTSHLYLFIGLFSVPLPRMKASWSQDFYLFYVLVMHSL
jgi:hypothetical protein